MAQRAASVRRAAAMDRCDGPVEPVGFHRKATSETLALSGTGQAIARRRGIKRGIAIGRQPCRHRSGAGCWAYVIVVRQVNWEHFSSGLWVGLTASTPQDLIGLLASGSLDFAADVPDTCVVGGEGVLWDGLECLNVDWHTGKLEMGDEIRVTMSARGEFRIKLNGQTVVSASKVHIPHNKPLYPLVELHGSTEVVELLADDFPISPTSQCRQMQEDEFEPREDVLVHHEHPRTPPQAHSPPFGGRQQLVMPSEYNEASSQVVAAATPEAWVVPAGTSPACSHSADRTQPPPLPLQSRSSTAVKPTKAPQTVPQPNPQRGEQARSTPKTRQVSSAAGQHLSGSSSASNLGTSQSSTSQAPRQPWRPGGTAPRHSGHSEERPQNQVNTSVRECIPSHGRIPNGGPSDWRAQARVWSTVDDCLANPHKHPEAFYAMCRELAATRAERDAVEAQYDEQRRQAAKSVSDSQRRDREIRKMREELQEQSSKLEESISAIEVLSKRTAAAQEAKNRAQHEAWQLRSQLEGDQKRSEKLDRKVSRALESAEQAATLPAPGGSSNRNAAHLRHLEATFESALSEIRNALGSELSSVPASVKKSSGQAAGTSASGSSPVKGGSARRHSSASPRPGRSQSAKRRPPRGPGSLTRKGEERPRPLAMSTSAESLSVADESTTCSSPRAGSGSVAGVPELAAAQMQAMLQGTALLRPEAGNTPTSSSHWAWPGDVITSPQATMLTARGDAPSGS